MVEEMTSRDAILQARGNHRVAGPMHPMPTMPPTDALYHTESLLREAQDLYSVHKIINNAYSHLGTPSEYWVDWVRVLAAHRCGKLKLKGEKRKLIDSTTFKGYHQF